MNERTPPTLLPPTASTPHAEAERASSVATAQAEAPAPKAPRLDPTRYGDWELNGKCVDF